MHSAPCAATVTLLCRTAIEQMYVLRCLNGSQSLIDTGKRSHTVRVAPTATHEHLANNTERYFASYALQWYGTQAAPPNSDLKPATPFKIHDFRRSFELSAMSK